MTILQDGQRILAIDYGSVRIGIALSDPMRIIASALETVANTPAIGGTIAALVGEHNVGMVVVGMPVNLKGQEERKAREVQAFVESLRSAVPVPVRTWDERFTSVMAHRSMIDAGLRKMQRREKGRVDRIAAAIVLQNFLDAKAYAND